MKHRRLHAIAHNYSDSLASGKGFVVGYYGTAVFADAAANVDGKLTVDFINGTIDATYVSANLLGAIVAYRAAFPDFCLKHDAEVDDFGEFRTEFFAGFGGNCFTVTIADRRGKRSSIKYKGIPGRRIKMLDPHGRVRPNVTIHPQ